VILSIFLQAKIPKHFQNYGNDDSENFQYPKLPENFDSLPDDEQELEAERYHRRQLHYFYLGFTHRNNAPHLHAMGTHDLVVRNRLYDTACRPWEGDNTSLKAEIIHASTHWPAIATSGMKNASFPVEYSDAEVTECRSIDEKQEAGAQMEQLRDYIGVDIDGWTPKEVYDEAKERERHLKEVTLQAAENEEDRREVYELWPFQDHEEVE
jgi:hypothetical protein